MPEKVLLLLFREGLVDDRGYLAADFGDGCEFDEQLGSGFKSGFSVGCSQDFCVVARSVSLQETRSGLTKFVIELGFNGGGHGIR